MITANAQKVAWLISEALQHIFYDTIKEKSGACIVSFKDPNYSPTTGGFHQVEIMIGSSGDIQYINDYAYAEVDVQA